MKFVLVHGGWQGGWAWDGVAAVLRAGGHEVFAPTLRGVSLADMAAGVIQEIGERELNGVVLVGHSGGGPVAQLVADRLGDGLGGRIHRIVFLAAWVLRDGESMNDVRPPHMVEAARAQAERSPDDTVPMDRERWASLFMQDATEEQLAQVLPRLVPCPFGFFDRPIDLPRFFDLRLASSYIFLRHDRAAPRERYERMAARLRDPQILECPGSHQAMQTRPHEVAAALVAATAGSRRDHRPPRRPIPA
jgi:pimeloyl-ACP methyl ester carboxylesterase